MKLIIAEKPSVAKSIASALGITSRADGFYEGNGLIVSWCVGHLVCPMDAAGYDEHYKNWRYADLPILPEPFRYVIAPGKEDAFENLRTLMNRPDVDTVVNACDAGREGELIFRLVYETAGCKKPVERLWISSMEDMAICEGFSDLRPGSEYEALYQSALCRQKADWLVGINATRLFSVLYHRTLNVGRVQTPTLAMLAERDAKINGFQKEKYHHVRLKVDGAEAVSEKIISPEDAQAVHAACSGASAVCTSVTREQKKEQPPKLYDLTTLQRETNRMFGYTAKQTLDYAQSLYEKKLLTYPRTDSRYLTSDMAETASCVIHLAAKVPPFGGCASFFPLVELMVSDKDVSDHHAIIPTMEIEKADIKALPVGERTLLLLVCCKLLCASAEPYEYEAVTATFDCGGYSVVYNYVDENGETKQKWETWRTHKEALKRKAEIENQQHTGTFLPPSNQKISEFLYDFVSLYGEKKWGVSMYDSQTALIANYINPIIGDMEVQAVTPRVVDGYVQTLQKTRSVSTKTRKATTTYVSNQTIEKIIKLLRCAFKQAVRWEIIARNPFDNVILPKTEYKKRDIWDADMIRTALDQCTDSKLYVAMNLSFACSLRMGEILGLTWDNVHISDEDIAADNAYVYVDKELTRASKRAIETLGEKDIYYIFTSLMPNTSTRIILKKPKTESSIRKVWLPKTLAYILREWKKSQDELRSFLGDEYQDFNLVVALPNGRPCEDRIILKEFSKLREEAGLPRVVFHSLRHSSTTYKLKLNHGDLKATQGDTGHAEIDMITSIYAHILDEDRKVNAQKFETAFYANPDLRSVRPPEEPKQPEPATLDLASLVEQLQKSPELASALAALIAAQAPAK